MQDSARHRANEWRGLDSAENDGSAERNIKRDRLLKIEPLKIDFDDSRAEMALCAYLCLRAFPAAPGKKEDIERHGKNGISAAQVRRLYYDDYCEYRDTIAAAFGRCSGPMEIRKAARDWLESRLREQMRTRGVRFDYSRSNCQICNVSAENTVYRQMKRASDNLTAEYVREIMERCEGIPTGRTVSKTKKFNERDAYTSRAERIGGREIVAPVAFLTESAKLRALQWGNYVSDKERPEHARLLAESFSDLAEVLGIEPAALAGESLAIAIGARGHSKAGAHFEPTTKTINLTRKHGIGALAHEIGHFIDSSAAGGVRFASETSRGGPWNDLARKMRDSKYYNRLCGALREFSIVTSGPRSYWLSGREMFARFFEVYVRMILHERGRKNTYLSGGNGHPLWPTFEEVAEIRREIEAAINDK